MALAVVRVTTSSANNDEKLGMMRTLGFKVVIEKLPNGHATTIRFDLKWKKNDNDEILTFQRKNVQCDFNM